MKYLLMMILVSGILNRVQKMKILKKSLENISRNLVSDSLFENLIEKTKVNTHE